MDWFYEIVRTSYLSGKKIILGITGGIACYKSIELMRQFQKAGAEVQVVMTKMAQRFLGPELLEALSGKKVLTDFEGMEHIYVPHSADLFVIAPATANIIGKIANGICDDILTTQVIASTVPCVIVPSMNWAMLKNPATQENIKKLRERGYIVVEPEEGDLACGERGEGKFPKIEKIFFWCEYAITPKIFSGEKVIVTAGPTKEFIDDVRFISNPSSGFMGYLIAREFAIWGADVKLITGGDEFDSPEFLSVSKVESSDDMFLEVQKNLPADIFVGSAAVSDFKPKTKIKGKIKKEKIEAEGGGKIILELVKTKDIIQSVNAKVKIGFSLEESNLQENAIEKMKKKKIDIIIANPLISFRKEESEFILIENRNGNIFSEKLGRKHKREIARIIVDKSFKILNSMR
ncbi:MAG: bifunctional phosphopantothenoylcysteine decarboxylase/phosphopantothenate--cysteine ligase CoaBC [Candidatus Calescibacterium sp.]|jgi:phosphopantothenoylcysteine decarboxylase/phosphopantothenate--cysteine ligase